MRTSTEVVRKVYDDDEGFHISVGPDSDGLDLVQISTDGEENKKFFGDLRLCLFPAMARELGHALIDTADELDKPKKPEAQ